MALLKTKKEVDEKMDRIYVAFVEKLGALTKKHFEELKAFIGKLDQQKIDALKKKLDTD